MIVAGIDPSLTSAGIAVLVNSAPIILTSVGKPGRNTATYHDRGNRIVKQSRHVINTILNQAGITQPDLVVIEGPSYESHTGHAFDRAGLWWGICTGCYAKGLPTAVVPPTTLKRWATGTGGAAKAEVTRAVQTWWPAARNRIANDDIADAAALALIGAFKLGDPMPFPVKDRHTTGLDAVAWPESIPA